MARELAPELKLELGRLGERGRSGSWGELEGGMAARLLLDKTMRMPERDRNARLGSDGGRRRATGYPGATTDQGPLALTFASAYLLGCFNYSPLLTASVFHDLLHHQGPRRSPCLARLEESCIRGGLPVLPHPALREPGVQGLRERGGHRDPRSDFF